MGSLLPSEGETPKFTQMYIHDPQMQEESRLNFIEELHPNILHQLQTMLHDVNPYAQLYENARRRLSSHPTAALSLRLVTLRNKDSRRYNTPTANEVGAIMVGDGTDTEQNSRDIIVKKKGGPLQRISILHPSYLPMHYVLLFPDGRDGWHPNIPLTGFTYDNDAGGFMENPYDNIEGQRGRGGSKRVSLSQFHAYTLHPRHDEHIFRAGRLLQQFIVDGYACAEENRLHFLCQHHSNLRVDIYKGAQDAMYQGDTDAAQIGQKLILPSSFTGGPRQMTQLYQDAMGIVRNCDKPDIFLTFTCNKKWEEITQSLLVGQVASDRPDLVSRVFHMKLKELISDLEKGLLGKLIGKVWVVEFQKRGLPHIHMLIIVDEDSKMRTPDAIDTMVSAELPNITTHPIAYETITKTMIHGPCGALNPKSTCMKDGKCSKRYPREFNSETKMDDDGYPSYRRRDNNVTYVNTRGHTIDNRWVVPHNLWLATKYNAHINVEVRIQFIVSFPLPYTKSLQTTPL